MLQLRNEEVAHFATVKRQRQELNICLPDCRAHEFNTLAMVCKEELWASASCCQLGIFGGSSKHPPKERP